MKAAYNKQDLVEVMFEPLKEKGYCYSFIRDLIGDHPEVFEDHRDNQMVAIKLKDLSAFGTQDLVDAERGCFYAHFKSVDAGVAFVKKLSAYIDQKTQLLKRAKAY